MKTVLIALSCALSLSLADEVPPTPVIKLDPENFLVRGYKYNSLIVDRNIKEPKENDIQIFLHCLIIPGENKGYVNPVAPATLTLTDPQNPNKEKLSVSTSSILMGSSKILRTNNFSFELPIVVPEGRWIIEGDLPIHIGKKLHHFNSVIKNNEGEINFDVNKIKFVPAKSDDGVSINQKQISIIIPNDSEIKELSFSKRGKRLKSKIIEKKKGPNKEEKQYVYEFDEELTDNIQVWGQIIEDLAITTVPIKVEISAAKPKPIETE